MMIRDDLNIYFNQSSMSHAGYLAMADVQSLKGQYILGLARGYKGRLEQCQQFKLVTLGFEVNDE